MTLEELNTKASIFLKLSLAVLLTLCSVGMFAYMFRNDVIGEVASCEIMVAPLVDKELEEAESVQLSEIIWANRAHKIVKCMQAKGYTFDLSNECELKNEEKSYLSQPKAVEHKCYQKRNILNAPGVF